MRTVLCLASTGLFAALVAGAAFLDTGAGPACMSDPSEHGPPDEQVVRLQRRIVAREAVVDELLARRLTLAEAAARFRDLNRQPPDFRASLHRWYHGATEEEIVCRQVIAWAREALRNGPPERAAAEVARLEAELQGLLDGPGGIRLPDR